METGQPLSGWSRRRLWGGRLQRRPLLQHDHRMVSKIPDLGKKIRPRDWILLL